MIEPIKSGTITTTVRLEVDFYNKLRLNGIKLIEAVRVGAGVLLAERGIEDYNSKLNIVRRLKLATDKLDKILRKAEEKGINLNEQDNISTE